MDTKNLIPELQYHTSIDVVQEPPSLKDLGLDYHTELTGSRALKENMEKLHPSLNENNIFALAYLILHPETREEEREMYKETLHNKIKAMHESSIPILKLLDETEAQIQTAWKELEPESFQ